MLEIEVPELQSSRTVVEDLLGRGVVLRCTSCKRYVNDFVGIRILIFLL
jgi:hypothetical protein